MWEVYDEKENVVDKLKTDQNGEAVSKRLPIDQKYTVKETKTGNTYVLNEEPQIVTLKEDQITDITFTNEKKKGQIKVIKVDLDNNEIKLENVEFKVYDEKGNVVDNLKTDKNGEAISKRLPIDQKYIVQESKTLETYVLNEEPQTVTLTQNQITDIQFENEKIKGKIEITKISADDNKLTGETKGTKLDGAIFEIYNEKDELIFSGRTDENGKITIPEIRYGKYYILEKEAPEGYTLNPERMYFEILEDGKVVKATMTDEKVVVEVPSTGITDTHIIEIAGAFVLGGIGVIVYVKKKKQK